MNFGEKIKHLIKTANTNHELMSDEMVERIFPDVKTELDTLAKKYNYDGWTWMQPEDGYPPMMYNMLMMNIKPIVYKFLDENHPEAWFKDIYNINFKLDEKNN